MLKLKNGKFYNEGENMLTDQQINDFLDFDMKNTKGRKFALKNINSENLKILENEFNILIQNKIDELYKNINEKERENYYIAVPFGVNDHDGLLPIMILFHKNKYPDFSNFNNLKVFTFSILPNKYNPYYSSKKPNYKDCSFFINFGNKDNNFKFYYSSAFDNAFRLLFLKQKLINDINV